MYYDSTASATDYFEYFKKYDFVRYSPRMTYDDTNNKVIEVRIIRDNIIWFIMLQLDSIMKQQSLLDLYFASNGLYSSLSYSFSLSLNYSIILLIYKSIIFL